MEHSMGAGPQPDRPQQTEIERKVERAKTRVLEVSQDLASRVEQTRPGDIFGQAKFDHMRELADTIAPYGVAAGLNRDEVALLSLVALVHDIGRYRETLSGFQTLRDGIRHGKLSVDIIDEHGLFDEFDSGTREQLRQAVFWHAEKNVDLMPETLGHSLCYVLRDLDKREIFTAAKFHEPHGVRDQLTRHYLDNPSVVAPTLDRAYPDRDPEIDTMLSRALRDQGAARFANEIIADALSGDSRSPNDSVWTHEERMCFLVIKDLLWKGIRTEDIETFASQSQIPVQAIKHSYATYMLMQLAMVFDISNPQILRELDQAGHFNRKLEFIKPRVSGSDFETISSTLDAYLRERGAINERYHS